MNKAVTKINTHITPEKAVKRVAIYARVSSERDEAATSIDAQINNYRRLVYSRLDWELVDVYVDDGISGTIKDRPGFTRLLEDCRAGKIDLILTKSLSRFARNTVVLLQSIRELNELNIEVRFETENINTLDENGELLLTLLAMYAEEYARNSSDVARWRYRKSYEKGRSFSNKMYGYRNNHGVYSVIPEEAKVVREIFRQYIEGHGYGQIAKSLNEKGIPWKYGEWQDSTVMYIIRNELYIGTVYLQQKYKDFHSKKCYVNKDKLPKYKVLHHHEPIINEDTFRMAEYIRHERSIFKKICSNEKKGEFAWK